VSDAIAALAQKLTDTVDLATTPEMLYGGFRAGDAVLIVDTSKKMAIGSGRIKEISGRTCTVTVSGTDIPNVSAYSLIWDNLDTDTQAYLKVQGIGALDY
jgi:hypothetical protein